MIKLHILFILFIVNFSILFGQNKVFSNSKLIVYYAEFIQNGDTLTKENVKIKPSKKKWFWQPWSQKSMKYLYDFDTANLKSFKDYLPASDSMKKAYFEKKGKVWTCKGFLVSDKQEITGYINNEKILFIHPPRKMQYGYTQLAPFPEVYFETLRDSVVMYKYDFYGENTSTVLTKVSPFKSQKYSDYKMWKLEGVSKSQKYGDNFIEIIYCHELGFVSIKYQLFNNTFINFELLEIIR